MERISFFDPVGRSSLGTCRRPVIFTSIQSMIMLCAARRSPFLLNAGSSCIALLSSVNAMHLTRVLLPWNLAKMLSSNLGLSLTSGH